MAVLGRTSQVHSAEVAASVNEQFDFAKKRENVRIAALGSQLCRRGDSMRHTNQNAGSRTRGPLLGLQSGKLGDQMASKTTLNVKNLEELGAQRLAELLVEISAGNAAAKRRLRLALAGAQSPKEAAREVAKRLTSIARARTFINWQNRKTLVTDLETQRRAIVIDLVKSDPEEALGLLWRFMSVATPVFDRCDDSSGTVIGIFRRACQDLGEVAIAAQADPTALAASILAALQDNGYGQYDGLIGTMASALGEDGLEQLKGLVNELGRTPVPVPPKDQWHAVGWSAKGTTYEHEMQESERLRTVTMALQDIADAQGDVDGFIAQYALESRRMPGIAAEIARRLLSVGRADEALDVLERAEVLKDRRISHEWQDARLEALEAVGRSEEAQAFRWDCFESHLSAEHLRAFLKKLPDFDDIEAEERAMAHVMSQSSLLAALQFFLDWPALDRAATLLMSRYDEIDGDHYEFLVPAAEALSERHPLAATLALRAMIDFTLSKARSKRYGYAAEHLGTCIQLSRGVEDFGEFETHDDYIVRLKAEHGKKSAFWSLAKG